MPVRIHVGLAKKVGQENFGSLGASCTVEFEVDGGYDNGSTERFQDAVRRAYAACREAVESELSAQESRQAAGIGGQQTTPTNRVANQTNGSQARRATTSQVRAIHAIANRNGADLASLLSQFNVSRPDDLSIGHASALIDQLKNPGGSPAVRQ